jgi:hypothetical protein
MQMTPRVRLEPRPRPVADLAAAVLAEAAAVLAEACGAGLVFRVRRKSATFPASPRCPVMLALLSVLSPGGCSLLGPDETTAGGNEDDACGPFSRILRPTNPPELEPS